MSSAYGKLRDYLANLADGGVCVAFSGGVDSAVILNVACELSGKVHAVTVSTPLHPKAEPRDAARLAAEYGAAHSIIDLQLPQPVIANPPDRCYHCKKEIFLNIRKYATANALAAVIDGTNADDLHEYRPGRRALAELGIKSPLAELGITKAEVREIAAQLGLSIAKKPAAPCMATRIPYNTPIDLPLLQRLEDIEAFVKSLGIAVTRARAHGDILRLEILPEYFTLLCENREEIISRAKDIGFTYITLDLEGFRSGSMDLKIKEGEA